MTSTNAQRATGGDATPLRRDSFRFSDAEVETWFAERDRPCSSSSSSSSLQLSAEELIGADFAARRIWHTALSTEFAGTSRDGATLILQIEGATIFSTLTTTIELSENDAIVLANTTGVTLSTHAPSARVEIELPWERVRTQEQMLLLPADRGTTAASALVSVLNAVMNPDSDPQPAVSAALLRAIDASIDALLLERLPREGRKRSSERLFHEAMEFIRTWGHSSTLSVPDIVEAMHVSRQYLTRVFTARGTTIAGELRRHRVHLAHSHLSDAFVTASEAAAAAGFASVVSMRRAIEREAEGDRM